ncbi:MHYT domain-containing protein [Rhodococcus sp. NPDC003348]
MSDQAVHHLSMGLWVVFLAVGTAAVGTYVGIACARRAAYAANRRRLWMLVAALSIGGVSFWLANVVTTAGFAVDGSAVRYDPVRVVGSLVLCLLATVAGLLISSPRSADEVESDSDTRIVKVMSGAVVMGLGLTAGYYVAMKAIEVQGRTYMDAALISVAGVVAVIASIGVLWMAAADVPRVVLAGGSIAVAVAPVVMHGAMMAALRVRLDGISPTPPGVEVFGILFPAFVVGMLILTVPTVALLMASDRATAELEAQARLWIQQDADQRQP